MVLEKILQKLALPLALAAGLSGCATMPKPMATSAGKACYGIDHSQKDTAVAIARYQKKLARDAVFGTGFEGESIIDLPRKLQDDNAQSALSGQYFSSSHDFNSEDPTIIWPPTIIAGYTGENPKICFESGPALVTHIDGYEKGKAHDPNQVKEIYQTLDALLSEHKEVNVSHSTFDTSHDPRFFLYNITAKRRDPSTIDIHVSSSIPGGSSEDGVYTFSKQGDTSIVFDGLGAAPQRDDGYIHAEWRPGFAVAMAHFLINAYGDQRRVTRKSLREVEQKLNEDLDGFTGVACGLTDLGDLARDAIATKAFDAALIKLALKPGDSVEYDPMFSTVVLGDQLLYSRGAKETKKEGNISCYTSKVSSFVPDTRRLYKTLRLLPDGSQVVIKNNDTTRPFLSSDSEMSVTREGDHFSIHMRGEEYGGMVNQYDCRVGPDLIVRGTERAVISGGCLHPYRPSPSRITQCQNALLVASLHVGLGNYTTDGNFSGTMQERFLR